MKVFVGDLGSGDIPWIIPSCSTHRYWDRGEVAKIMFAVSDATGVELVQDRCGDIAYKYGIRPVKSVGYTNGGVWFFADEVEEIERLKKLRAENRRCEEEWEMHFKHDGAELHLGRPMYSFTKCRPCRLCGKYFRPGVVTTRWVGLSDRAFAWFHRKSNRKIKYGDARNGFELCIGCWKRMQAPNDRIEAAYEERLDIMRAVRSLEQEVRDVKRKQDEDDRGCARVASGDNGAGEIRCDVH